MTALHFGRLPLSEGECAHSLPFVWCGDAVLFRHLGLSGVCSSKLTASLGMRLLLLAGMGLLLLLFGVVHHELEEGREGGAVPPMAGSKCSPAELG